MRILAVDPGEKRLGIAISDPTETIANPLMVIKHVSRVEDADAIVHLAREYEAERIVIGQALNAENEPTLQSRRAANLAEAVRDACDMDVVLWDEGGSTQEARASRIIMGTSRRKRRGHLDDIAAAVILQSYLESIRE